MDRETLIRAILECNFAGFNSDTIDVAVKRIMECTGDKPVRCKDCKYWEYDVIFLDGWCRGKHQGNPNWFCADGERRKDA